MKGMLREIVFGWWVLASLCPAASPVLSSDSLQENFPELPGFHTIACDLHLHTVFSDGDVWPSVRVQEAIREGLHAIAITDHFEHQPHQADLPNLNRNRSYEIARAAAQRTDLLVIPGVEVTRNMPPGHLNVLFISDANTINESDVAALLTRAAREQAFVFWNHPWWLRQTPDGVARMTTLHDELIRSGLIHGVEVANNDQFSPEAMQIALDHNLTMLGNSDLHSLSDWKYPRDSGAHRPVTLVFARERTAAGLKTALFDRRTLVWYKNTLIGRADWMALMLDASLTAHIEKDQTSASVVQLTITNNSPTKHVLRNISTASALSATDVIEVRANSSAKFAVRTDSSEGGRIKFEVLSALVGPRRHPEIEFNLVSSALQPLPAAPLSPD
jgi:hypothetical protein